MNKKIKLSLICNLLIFVMEVIAFILCMLFDSDKKFIYYTTDSNIFTGISCGLLAVYQFLYLKKVKEIPYFIKVLKYISTCMLTVTFLTVIFILIPASGSIDEMIRMLFSPKLLFHHTLCPILCIVSFIFFEKGYCLNKKKIFYSLIPTLVYAIILIVLNALNIVEGPYFFLRVHNQPIYMSIIWFVAILLGAFGIACLLYFLNRIKEK